MRALIIYESMFGCTKQVAEAIAGGLARHGHVDTIEVSEAALPLPQDLDLLVVGGPTHAFGLSRPDTRKSAVQQAPDGVISRGPGIREWLDQLSGLDLNVPTAAFGTKLAKAWLPGSSARAAAKRLKHLGLPQAVTPENFYVTGTTGPLKDGELVRAGQWGDALGRADHGLREEG